MDKKTIKNICRAQKDEIEGYVIYSKLAGMEKKADNAGILREIAEHELKHYRMLLEYTGIEVKASGLRVFFFIAMAKLFGLTFSLKLMERGEQNAEEAYKGIGEHVPEVEQILIDEDSHEQILLDMIDEEALNYVGSIVLGLNDALVELTGALAGFTFAIQNSRTIALMGLITGFAATLSMAASEFLSQRHEAADSDEESKTSPGKSSLYTGLAYVVTVILLVLPYFLFANPFISLAVMIAIVLLIIIFFTFYISVTKNQPFGARFREMALISIGVAVLSFGIGWLVRTYLGLDI